ncbi:MAG: SRPBCC domain-containing protein [Flavobacteriales bacterium]|nr:SRPBCC domain-containing protein [Flavobacteriales bacterium]
MIKPLDPETNVLRTLLVDAPQEFIWKALTDPNITRLYTSRAISQDLRQGEPLQWYSREEDSTRHMMAKGMVLALVPGERLRYTHYHVGSDLPDEFANYTTVDIHLTPEPDGRTRVDLWEGDFAGLPQAVKRAREAGKVWVEALVGLKRESEEQARLMAA